VRARTNVRGVTDSVLHMVHTCDVDRTTSHHAVQQLFATCNQRTTVVPQRGSASAVVLPAAATDARRNHTCVPIAALIQGMHWLNGARSESKTCNAGELACASTVLHDAFLLTFCVCKKGPSSGLVRTHLGAMGEPLPPTSEWAAESVGLVMQELTRRRVDVSRYMLVGHVGSLGCIACIQ
jgi:hypothetical protein